MAPSRVNHVSLVLLAAVGGLVGLGGCANKAGVFEDTEGKWFAKPIAVFSREDGSLAAANNKNFQLGPTGPVPAEELVGPDGSCAAPVVVETPPGGSAPVPASAPVTAPAGLEPGNPPLVGGIALGMTECQTVRRGGVPSNVSIGVGDNNDRKVVVTYLTGNWPGIYTFSGGRLKEISAAPVQPKPVAAKKPAKKVAKPRAAPAAPVTRIQ